MYVALIMRVGLWSKSLAAPASCEAPAGMLLQAKPWSQALASARNSSESGCGWKTTLSDALPCVNAKLC